MPVQAGSQSDNPRAEEQAAGGSSIRRRIRAGLERERQRHRDEIIAGQPAIAERALSLAAAAIGGLMVLASSQTGWLFLAISWLTTWGHEASHALAGVLTGGHVTTMIILPGGNGATDTGGGLKPVIAWAGYPGGLLWGALLWRLADQARRWLIFAVAAAIVLTALLLAHDPMTSRILLAIIALVAVPRILPWPTVASIWMKVLGATVFIFGWWRIIGLLAIDTDGDHQILESMTGLDARTWTGTWCVTGVLITIWIVQSEIRAWQKGSPWKGQERRAGWDGRERRKIAPASDPPAGQEQHGQVS